MNVDGSTQKQCISNLGSTSFFLFVNIVSYSTVFHNLSFNHESSDPSDSLINSYLPQSIRRSVKNSYLLNALSIHIALELWIILNNHLISYYFIFVVFNSMINFPTHGGFIWSRDGVVKHIIVVLNIEWKYCNSEIVNIESVRRKNGIKYWVMREKKHKRAKGNAACDYQAQKSARPLRQNQGFCCQSRKVKSTFIRREFHQKPQNQIYSLFWGLYWNGKESQNKMLYKNIDEK